MKIRPLNSGEFGGFLFPPFEEFDEKESDARPNEFAEADDEGHEDAGAGGHSQAVDGKQETSLATSELEGDEEQKVCQKRREGEDEDALYVIGAGHDDEQDEEDFERREDAAGEFEGDGSHEGARVLTVEGCYLGIDGVELLAMVLDERTRPPFDKGYMTQQVHGSEGQPFAVADDEEPKSQQAEGSCGAEEDAHEEVDGLGEDVEEDGEQPEPEVAEHVGHRVEDDGR